MTEEVIDRIRNEKPIIESIRDFIAQCPFLDEYASLLVDRLEDDVSAYSIEPVPCKPIVKTYLDGTTLRRYEFHLASREAYTQEVLDQINNSAFYERFAQWLELCSRRNILPALNGERLSTKIEALTPGYIATADETKARYVIQCALTYMQAD